MHRRHWRAAWGDACPRLSARTARQQRHSRELWRRCAAHKRLCCARWARCVPTTRPCALTMRHCEAKWPLCAMSCLHSTMRWPSFAARCRGCLPQEGRVGADTVKAEPPVVPLRLPARPAASAAAQRASRHSGSCSADPTRDAHRPAGRRSCPRAHLCEGREGTRICAPALTCDAILLCPFASLLRWAGWQLRAPSRCPQLLRRWPQCTRARGHMSVHASRRPFTRGTISIPR